MYNNVHDDVTCIDICEIVQDTKIKIYSETNFIFSSNKNPFMIHLRLQYGRNGFLAEPTFQIDIIVSLNADVQQLPDCESTFGQKKVL